MSVHAVRPDTARVARLAAVVLVLDVVLTALFAVAARSSSGDADALFWLLAGSAAAGGVAAAVTLLAVRAPGRHWVALGTGALVVSVALLAVATTRDGGTVLPLAMLPVLLVEWWLLRGLREVGSR